MPVEWDAIRRELGGTYEVGSWFCVPEELVRHQRSGRQFANKRGERRVVQASRPGPNAVLFPRSTSIPGPFEHAKHAHPEWEATCKVDRQGWVQLDVPVTVCADALGQDCYSCHEPDDTGLLDAIRRAVAV